MEEIKLSKMQRRILDYIIAEHSANGKFVETNRQLGILFGCKPESIKYHIKVLQQKGAVTCKTVVEDSGYVMRYITPIL